MAWSMNTPHTLDTAQIKLLDLQIPRTKNTEYRYRVFGSTVLELGWSKTNMASAEAPGEEKVTDATSTGGQPAHRGNLLLTLPTHLWRHVLTFHGYKDYTLAGRACQYLKRLWTEAVEKGKLPLFVPVDCNTLKEAVDRVHGDDRLTTVVEGKGEHFVF